LEGEGDEKGDGLMEPSADSLGWRAGQRQLTPDQEADVKRFARAYCHDQLSTEPVDEEEVEACLRQVYAAVGRAAPPQIRWLDGPLQLVDAFDSNGVGERVAASVWDDVADTLTDALKADLWRILGTNLKDVLWAFAEDSILAGEPVTALDLDIASALGVSLGDSQWRSEWERPEDGVKHQIRYSVGGSVNAGVAGYGAAFWLAYYHYFALALRLDGLRAFCRFNQLVSGYWLGKEVVLLVRRPKFLAMDAAGLLHNASGKCVEYRDGWGFYAWHEVPVSARIILEPETLTRDDFLQEPNLEIRRIIQERMGERFVAELGGRVLDAGTRGTLYEVRLPKDDPEGVARYVQVHDASTRRTYFLRVPPTVETAAEAVAWTFSLTSEEYHPARES
jgi:hypothetical protein